MKIMMAENSEVKSMVICFLGPDGSGKSTIINKLWNTNKPFDKKKYFHLKPIKNTKFSERNTINIDPHKYPPYSKLKSYLKLLYFVYQYNVGWFENIKPLLKNSTLVIFDRYYDDMLVDHLRYRYGGSGTFAKFIRNFIPRPELYFILTADTPVILKRKQEVPFKELERQITAYRALTDNKRFIHVDVNREIDEIVLEITNVLMQRMNERN